MNPYQTLLLTCITCLAAAACSSDEPDKALPEIVVDDSRPINDPVAGQVQLIGGRRVLEFVMAEDGVLDGIFVGASQLAEAQAPADVSDPMSAGGFTILSLPGSGELTLRSEGTIFHYEPEANFSGTDSFTYKAADDADYQVVIEIMPVPDPPILDGQLLQVANQGRLYSQLLQATDADGDEVRFSARGLPDWLVLDSNTGVLSGVPQQSDVGEFTSITLTATDSTGLKGSIDDFELTVVDINDPPELNISQVPKVMYGREKLSFRVFPTDLDGDTVAISVAPDPSFESTVSGDLIDLQINDVIEAQFTQMIIVARDERGAASREIIDVSILPRTASGKGTTIHGFREGRGIHVVVLGDGYAPDEQMKFRRHVEGVLDNIRSDEGIASHLGAFNIHRVEISSQQSGADDSDTKDTVDTAFDSAYNCRSIPRLICADTLKLFEASLAEYPAVEQIILLVNDIRFGGSGNSGGRIAVTSAFYPEIALHEMGHSLADLADEYVDPLIQETSGMPPFEEGRYRNVSILTDPAQVPWAHWIDQNQPLPRFPNDEGVGIFTGGLYRPTGVYRATFDSRMRNYAEPFGPVNTEQWLLRLYTLTEGIRNLMPRAESLQVVAGEFAGFSVEPIFGFDVQAVGWMLNGEPLLASGANTSALLAGVPEALFSDPETLNGITLELFGGGALQALADEALSSLALSLPPGQHQLTMTVSDTSGRIQVNEPHAGIFTWTWNIRAL